MSWTIVLCSEIKPFWENRICDHDFALQFPGAGWIPCFADKLKQAGHAFLTSDLALQQIAEGKLAPERTILICGEHARHGLELIKLGCKPGVMICAESPMFARKFYDRIRFYCDPYPIKCLFKGTIDQFYPNDPLALRTRFAIYRRSDGFKPGMPWAERKPMAMVVSNKYWRHPLELKRLLKKPSSIFGWIRSKLCLSNSPINRHTMKHQLHDYRLSLIQHFAAKGLDLYGKGWDQVQNLPFVWRRRLAPVLSKLSAKQCADKHETISQYKFCVALENVAAPGYLTEKIIDCFVAGVVPLYLGDPDVTSHIPEGSFVDLRRFKTMPALEQHLNEMTEEQAQAIIRAGRAYLESESGLQHDYEGQASFIFQKVAKQFSLEPSHQ